MQGRWVTLLPRRRLCEACSAMSVGKFLVEKHSKIVAVVFPASIAFGCLYTVHQGTNPVADLRSWATGAPCCCRSSTPELLSNLSRCPGVLALHFEKVKVSLCHRD